MKRAVRVALDLAAQMFPQDPDVLHVFGSSAGSSVSADLRVQQKPNIDSNDIHAKQTAGLQITVLFCYIQIPEIVLFLQYPVKSQPSVFHVWPIGFTLKC